jgi:hypothetical protein
VMSRASSTTLMNHHSLPAGAPPGAAVPLKRRAAQSVTGSVTRP